MPSQVVFRLRSAFVLALTCTTLAVEAAESVPYGVFNGRLFKVIRTEGDYSRVVEVDGTERRCRNADLGEIVDFQKVADAANDDLGRSFANLDAECKALRSRLAAECDDGYLEMAAAVLAVRRTGRTGDDADRNGIMLADREHRLEELVAACEAFDVDRLVAILKQCEYVADFVDSSVAALEKESLEADRKKTWVDAEIRAQTGERKRELQKQAVELGAEAQRMAALCRLLREKRSVGEQVREDVDALQSSYFQTYEKATQLLRAYATIRDRLSRGVEMGDAESMVASVVADWAREMVKPETLTAAEDASTALALLNTRRNPQPKHIETPQAPSPEKPRRPQQPSQPPKKKGCFVATAVYGSYEHPDVMVLRSFRDDVLVSFAAGRRFIDWYYCKGPDAARWLDGHPSLKPPIRMGLSGVVIVLRHPFLLIVVCSSILVFLRKRRIRREARGTLEVENASST